MRRRVRKQQAEWRGEIAAAMALLLGLALLRAPEPLVQVGGGLLALAGGIPLTLLALRVMRQWRDDRAADFADAQRKVRKAERRRREAANKERVLKERGVMDKAERKRMSAEAALERAAREAEEAAAQKRREREQQMEAQARRWQILPEAERRAELTALLRSRGLEPLPNPVPETELRFAGSNRVALYLPAGQRAERADLERLHALRLKHKASKAWLIAPEGFAPQAVQTLPEFPALTLTDAHQIAKMMTDESNAPGY